MSEIFFNPSKLKLKTDAKRMLKNGKINKAQFDLIIKSINSNNYDKWDINNFEKFKEKLEALSTSFIPQPKSQLKSIAKQKLKKGFINNAQYEYFLSIANLKDYENLKEKDFEDIFEKLEGLKESNTNVIARSIVSRSTERSKGDEAIYINERVGERFAGEKETVNEKQYTPLPEEEKKKKSKKETAKNLQQLDIFGMFMAQKSTVD